MKYLSLASAGLVSLTLTACDTVPLDAPLQTSGPVSTSFATDEAQCKAEASRVGQGHIGKSAALGGAGGALIGATENSDKALVGAIVGAATAAAVGDVQVKQAQRDYLVRCMQQRGHAVTG